jgi:hypothetical protein
LIRFRTLREVTEPLLRGVNKATNVLIKTRLMKREGSELAWGVPNLGTLVRWDSHIGNLV